jgi:hypothetical protein
MVDGKFVTKDKGWGSNLQNIEKSMREIYVPDKGKGLGQTDQSGAEALIVAYMTRDGKYRSLFKNGIKPHTYICVHLFEDVWPKKMQELGLLTSSVPLDMKEIIRCPIPELKNHPYWGSLKECISDSDNWSLTERYYYLGKQTEHSSNYDIQPPTFRMNILEKSGGKILISVKDSERFIKTKHTLYPEIKEDYHSFVKMMIKKTGYLYDLNGFPHAITVDIDSITETDWKQYYALIPQATVAGITMKALTAFFRYTEENNLDWDVLAETHDSFLWQAPVHQLLDAARVARQCMNQNLVSPFDGAEFQMGSETGIGQNWRPYHKDKNPLGLKALKPNDY